MILDLTDRQSQTWAKLKKYLEQTLREDRESNDNRLSDLDTARLRGAIARTKVILALGDDPGQVIKAG